MLPGFTITTVSCQEGFSSPGIYVKTYAFPHASAHNILSPWNQPFSTALKSEAYLK